MMERCYNRGCGQEYDPTKNEDDSCRHHPGEPFFHDAYKGWSCCNKKSVDFTEFLNIKGCTLSKHSNVKPVKEETSKESKDGQEQKTNEKPSIDANETHPIPTPIVTPMERPSFDSEMVEIKATVARALKEIVDPILTAKAEGKEEAISIETLTIGTTCKNSGCDHSYTGTVKDKEKCQYHEGIPIFHEGLKFWSCCNRRTTDFAVFMSQPGCTYGEHVWLKKSNTDNKSIQCRYDWHQTPANVIVSIFAKKYDYTKSKIKVNPIRLQVMLYFLDEKDSEFSLDIELSGLIKVKETICNMFSCKVEITMPKAEIGTWKKLENVRRPIVKDTTKMNILPSIVDSKGYEEFDLNDIEASVGVQLSELARTKPKDSN